VENIHLTLKFLGDASPTNLERLAEALKMEAAACESFPITVGGFGAYPSPRRARVLWIGLQAPAALAALQRSVEAAAARLGYAPEERPFSPHLTVGRAGQKLTPPQAQQIRTILESTAIGELGSFQVEAVHIFKSDLHPGGPVYSCLFSLPMKPQP
jgi:2'-5' RNA ligase